MCKVALTIRMRTTNFVVTRLDYFQKLKNYCRSKSKLTRSRTKLNGDQWEKYNFSVYSACQISKFINRSFCTVYRGSAVNLPARARPRRYRGLVSNLLTNICVHCGVSSRSSGIGCAENAEYGKRVLKRPHSVHERRLPTLTLKCHGPFSRLLAFILRSQSFLFWTALFIFGCLQSKNRHSHSNTEVSSLFLRLRLAIISLLISSKIYL